MSFFRGMGAIIQKDLTAEFRTKHLVSSMLIFAVLTLIVFVFSFDPAKDVVKQVFPGMIWVCIIFAGMLGLNRSFVSEKQNDCLTGMLLCPVSSNAIYYGKTISNLIYMFIVEVVTIPLFSVLFNYPIPIKSIFPLILILSLGTIGFMAVGTFLAALSSNAKSSEILLPVILFPVLVPIVLGAVQATSAILSGTQASDWFSWFKILAAFDMIFLAIPLLLFEYVLEV